ncbi:conserved hypothetical protein [Neospora caninum Liverpool]|uniref:BSD domain-containing protein n=1 Tax=Neospora caninum (strain Liverpool) TaxID=572307 RepID=F0VQA8_NEOCL|nr:conserved hypothetical protein [Neospora caninum Liverpool]CBZ55905.1 conserved hypothetical protein [Neospora caninum Liverpool]CEL70648.1 TPA: hypothetical protein BN1204_063310 [Neospora caninum Liverpool]|eukprot:XP_003885931.1 conserved hypothetical protein [Neospora caninum Liverpool]
MEGGSVGRLEEAFQEVSLGGKKGTFFLTSKALAFITRVDGSSAQEGGQEGGGEKKESEDLPEPAGSDKTQFELQLLVWLQQWTSTERSKKSAKARLTFSNAAVLPSASACVPATSTAVLDFGTDRGKMDAACNLLQQLHTAERHRHPVSLHACDASSQERQVFLEDLKSALALPATSDLHASLSLRVLLLPAAFAAIAAPSSRSPSLPGAEVAQESERASVAPGCATPPRVQSGRTPDPAGTPGSGVHTPGGQGEGRQEGVSDSGKKRGVASGLGSRGDDSAPGLPKRTKSASGPGKDQQKPAKLQQPSLSSPPTPLAAAPVGVRPRLHLETVERFESLREEREVVATRRSLLQKNAVLRNLYQFLVGEPDESDLGDRSNEADPDTGDAANGRSLSAGKNVKKGREGRTPGKVLSREEFWKLHETDVVAHRAQLAPDPPASAFLIRPPQFEYVGGSGTGGSEKPSLFVDCSEQMLEAILEEDPRIHEVYRQLVPTGRITREKFFERLFQSKYFQEFLGLPARASAVGHTALDGLSGDDAGALINLSNTAPTILAPSPQTVLELATPSEDLISTEAFRLRGFGTADGLNSFGGDFVDSTGATVRTTSALDPQADALPGVPSTRRPLQSRLLERFNRQSHRLLLQHMLPPTAVAAQQTGPGAPSGGESATAGELARVHEQLQLLADQEQKIFGAQQENRRSRQGPSGKAPRPHTRPTETGPALKNHRVAEDIRLSDLAAPETVSYQRLEVSRRQLYAAGSRTAPWLLAKTRAAAAACVEGETSRPADNATSGDAAQRESAAREAEKHEAEEWIRSAAQRVEGHTVTPGAALYETGRYMFVFNTKLCQSEKVAHVAALDYEPVTVSAVRVHQARVTELLQHFYASAVPDEEKRKRIIQALDATKNELERTQESTFGPYTGAATKALCMPLFDQINAAKLHHNKLKKLLSDLRAQRKSHHLRHAALTQPPAPQPDERREAISAGS